MAEGDLAYRLAEEQKRLAKLWDAYETQEQELKQALKKIAVLEAKLKEKDRINTSLRELAEGREREIREAEVNLHSISRELEEYRPQLENLQKTLKDERDKYSRLFAITQELEEELNLAHLQLDGRDRWFQENLAALRGLDLPSGHEFRGACRGRPDLVFDGCGKSAHGGIGRFVVMILEAGFELLAPFSQSLAQLGFEFFAA